MLGRVVSAAGDPLDGKGPIVTNESAFIESFFYAGDRDEPPHVHVERDNNQAKFCWRWLDFNETMALKERS